MVNIGAELPKLSQKPNWVSVFGPPFMLKTSSQLERSQQQNVAGIKSTERVPIGYCNLPVQIFLAKEKNLLDQL